MDMAVVTLSRWQFAITVISHFIFVPTTIGLITTTLIFELVYTFRKCKDSEHYGRLALFFAKIAFLSFGCGVVTGLVMEMQFGMNWSPFAAFYGDVAGVPVTLETLTAFFLETIMLGLWRFTWGKINKKMHAAIGILLFLTSLLSIFWIIAVNAFMQNPVGYTMEGGQARLDSVFSLLENPQWLPQVLHVFFGIMILGGFVTAGIAAWQILQKKQVELFKKALQIGLIVALPFAIVQPLMGDNQIFKTAYLQGMKFAAMEADYEDHGDENHGGPWAAVAFADEDAHEALRLDIPNLGSYFVYGAFKGPVTGMKTIAEQYHELYDDIMVPEYGAAEDVNYYPPVNLLYWTFRWMVYSGYYFCVIGAMAMILLHRKS
jgi:cytochrome d ubiquinol oxidase subunit I